MHSHNRMEKQVMHMQHLFDIASKMIASDAQSEGKNKSTASLAIVEGQGKLLPYLKAAQDDPSPNNTAALFNQMQAFGKKEMGTSGRKRQMAISKCLRDSPDIISDPKT